MFQDNLIFLPSFYCLIIHQSLNIGLPASISDCLTTYSRFFLSLNACSGLGIKTIPIVIITTSWLESFISYYFYLNFLYSKDSEIDIIKQIILFSFLIRQVFFQSLLFVYQYFF